MAESLPQLPEVERLSPRVIRILGGNPGKFTLQGTNTYLVGQGATRILIDTGEGRPAWRDNLHRCLDREHAVVNKVLLTHWHPDHVGGVNDVRCLAKEAGQAIEIFKHQPWEGQHGIGEDETFLTQGATLRAVRCPGHTKDHVALVLEEENAMFTGDNVLGHGTAVFEDLATYMASLESMKARFTGRAYPGHGDVVEDGPAKVQEYLRHRRAREEQTLAVLKTNRPHEDAGEGWESMSIVKVIYADYPEALHGPAEGSVLQVLRKLETDGRARQFDDGTWGCIITSSQL